ncbi:MAG: hypothetical protein RL653_3860 [Pseudomonadota bacterium]|jgi:FdhD protein
MAEAVLPFRVTHLRGGRLHDAEDLVAVEAPLEIRVNGKVLTVTMRTPGHDAELAVGYLVSEGILRGRSDLADVRPGLEPNTVEVSLRQGLHVDTARAERTTWTSSSCGACGKGSLDAVAMPECPPVRELTPTLSGAHLARLPVLLREAQAAFASTGGIHATGLFTAGGALEWIREDVGRHNAFDKVVGAAFLAGRLPLAGHVALVSGRASFELVQKAAMAGLRVLLAVGAPSSLAVELAERQGLTLAGFVREGRFNLYSGAGRILA